MLKIYWNLLYAERYLLMMEASKDYHYDCLHRVQIAIDLAKETIGPITADLLYKQFVEEMKCREPR